MARYAGYLIKVGNYTMTGENYINIETYKGTDNHQDLNPFQDANGKLHRNVLAHKRMKVEFETRKNLTDSDVDKLFKAFRNNYSKPQERKALITAWIPELSEYVTQECYLVDPEITISHIDTNTNTIKYNPIRIAWIAY